MALLINNIFTKLWNTNITDVINDLNYYGIVKYEGVFFIQHFNKQIIDELCEKFCLTLDNPDSIIYGVGNRDRDRYSQRNVIKTLKPAGYYILGSAPTHQAITRELKVVLEGYNFLKGIEDLAEYQFDTYPEHLV